MPAELWEIDPITSSWIKRGSNETAHSPDWREGWGEPVIVENFEGTNGSAPNPELWWRRGLPASDFYLGNTDTQGIIKAENSYLQDGELIIKTERRADYYKPQPDAPKQRWYDTGYIDTMPRSGFSGAEQRYGRWEIQAHSLAPGVTAGIWSAFWLRTNQDGGEVDVFEHVGTPAGRGADGTTAGSWPYASRWPDSGIRSQAVFFEETGKTSNSPGQAYHESRYDLPVPYNGWHTYAAEWTPDRFSCYCDDVLVGEIRRGQRPTNGAGVQPTGPNANLDDGAKILDGGFGPGAKVHTRLDVHVGFPNVGEASVLNTDSPHYMRYRKFRVWAWDGQE